MNATRESLREARQRKLERAGATPDQAYAMALAEENERLRSALRELLQHPHEPGHIVATARKALA